MSDELKKGNEVQLADFGTFALAEKSIKLVIKKKISKSKK
jgi:nucleoid DNA-binding protein